MAATIIIVTGRPAAGKTTLAKWLARELQMPLVSRDAIREALYDQIDSKDWRRARSWARPAAVALVFHFAERQLEVGCPVILDDTFDPTYWTPRFQALKHKHDAHIIQVVCDADREILFQRFTERARSGGRHPGHADEDESKQARLRKYLDEKRGCVLQIEGDVIEVDTSDFAGVDRQAILGRVKSIFESRTVSETPSAVLAASIEAARREVGARPDDVEARSELARLCALARSTREAIDHYLKAGALLFAAEKFTEAIAPWEKALALDARCIAAQLNIGKALRRLGKNEQALAAYRNAASIDERNAAAWSNLAALHYAGGRLDEAEEASRKRLALRPDDPTAFAALARVLERKGGFQEGHDLLRPLVLAGTNDPEALAAFACMCQRLSPPLAEGIAPLERELQRPGLAAPVRAKLLFALAQLNDALGRPGEALDAMTRSRHCLPPDDPAGKRAVARARMWEAARAYTPERLARLPRARHGSELPVFIVGMPRSGTTLAEQILSSHPRVYGAGELKHIPRLALESVARRLPYPDCLDALTPAGVEGIARAYLDNVRALAPAATRITDKMFMNFQHLGLIQTLFPRARVIHCIRHPLDTCISIFMNEIANFTENRDLASVGAFYREYWKQMEYWQGVLTLPIFPLRYEELLLSPERVVRALLQFCGLDWDERCMRFYESDRFVATISYYQVRQQLYTRSVGRYRAYEADLGPLRQALGGVLDEVESQLPALEPV